MSLDGLFIHSLTQELHQVLSKGRINKIQQPYDQEILLTIRQDRRTYKLLLAATPSAPRIQLTQRAYSIPETPQNFCMFLRKHIEGATITGVHQYEADRIVSVDLCCYNELGDPLKRHLVIEIMGRRSNILVLDEEHTIMDLITKIPPALNRYRTLLPGAHYCLPPQANRENPFTHLETFPFDEELSKVSLQAYFMGFGADSAQEVLYRLKGQSPDEQVHRFKTFIQSFMQPRPCLTKKDNKVHMTAFPYEHLLGERQTFDSLSQLMDAYYDQVSQYTRINQVSEQLGQVVNKKLKHCQKKLANLAKDEEKSQSAEDYQLKGELLTASLYQLHKGQTEVTLPNYYANGAPITISLDPALSPSDNAQKYFRQYRKYTHAKEHIEEQKAKTQGEVDYLLSISGLLTYAEDNELQAIKQELILQGYLSSPHQKRKSKNTTPLQARHYPSVAGNSIWIGRNNTQNDQLTLKKAHKDYYWFHTQNIPGSHVILGTDHPTDEELLQAASYAAYFSKYRYATHVPVDYTQVKHVKKPKGAKPGLVNYFKQTTLYVSPTSPDPK